MGAQIMTKGLGENQWPPIDDAYSDVDGQIDPAVYLAASELWGWACSFAVSTLRNRDAAYDLLKQAVALVSQESSKRDRHIENIKAYLRQTYKHLVLYELQRDNRRRDLLNRFGIQSEPASVGVADQIDRRILIEQLYQRMDSWMRQAFDLLVLGYSADAVARFLRMKPNHFRSKYSKRLSKLKEQIDAETREMVK